MDSLGELVAQVDDFSLVDDMGEMLQIERYVVGLLGEQDGRLSEGMCVADLVKHVGVAAGHVGDDDVGLGNLVVDAM